MIRVALVEDDRYVRESLAVLINGHPDFSCTATYADAESALQGIVAHPPDVVLMDLGLPGLSGLDAIRQLKALLPTLDLLVLTIHEKDEVVFEALCAGACGYLVKSVGPRSLLAAIRDIHQGGAPMSSQIARMVVRSFQGRPPSPSPLTPRETEVLSELCQGKSYKVIADALTISQDTVRCHLKNIYKKLEVHSKSAAVAKAFQTGLVPHHPTPSR